jgi:hypothetical protein
MKSEFEEHRYFMEISELKYISKVEIEQFVMHLNHMSDWLIFDLLTNKNSEKGIL